MAEPYGGWREKVKINENSSSAGAIEKFLVAFEGEARVWDMSFFYKLQRLPLPLYVRLPPYK